MNCPDSTILMRWLDGELSREEAGNIKKHLESCPDCLSLVETQRKMESAWRENWTDPAPAAFETLRRNLSARSVPWWRRQRSWMAVAAVFAVYLGVKIFLIDGAGRPMSEVATEGAPAFAPGYISSEPDVLSAVADDSADAPLEQQEIMEEEQEEEQQQQEIVAPQTAEQIEESIEEELPPPMENIAEEPAFAETQSLSPGESSGLGTQRSIGAGGGGLISEGIPEGGLSIMDDASREEETLSYSCDGLSGAAFSSAAAVPADIQVSAELQGGETISLYRDVWPEVFMLLDTIFDSGEYTPGEPVSIFVDHSGLATGPLVPEGTIIALPDSTWGNSSITACSP